jgi:HipA N-terminal domain
MISELFVLIGDSIAGKITRHRGSLRFVYDVEYQHENDPTPLSVSMPVALTTHTDQAGRFRRRGARSRRPLAGFGSAETIGGCGFGSDRVGSNDTWF